MAASICVLSMHSCYHNAYPNARGVAGLFWPWYPVLVRSVESMNRRPLIESRRALDIPASAGLE